MSTAHAPAGRVVGGTIVTQDAAGTVLNEGEVAWGPDGVITYVGPARGPAGPEDVHAAGAIVVPGLVNAHTHSAMTLLRGYSDDCDLPTWLGHIRDFEVGMTVDDIRAGLELALVEMIRSGTTTFSDMYLWDADLLGLVAASGLRVLAAPAVFGPDDVGYPAACDASGSDALDLTERLAREFAGDRQIRIAFGPHAPYTCPPELYADVAARAARLGVPVHTHLSETAAEVEQCRARYGATPIAHVAARGLLDVPVLAAHCVHVTDEDIELLARSGAAVAHNPVSNLKLGAGIAPLPRLREAGVRVGLGTDSAASNNTLDLFEEIKLASLLPRGVGRSPDVVLGADALAMATGDGAAACGFPEAGVLEPGRFADVVVVGTQGAHATPLHDPVSFLAFAARGADVRDVVVGGRRVLADGLVLTLDEPEIRARVAVAVAHHRPSPGHPTPTSETR